MHILFTLRGTEKKTRFTSVYVCYYYYYYIILAGLTTPHLCPCPKPRPGFPTSYVLAYIQ